MSSEELVGSVFVELTLDDSKYKNSMNQVKDDAGKSSSTIMNSLKGGMGTALTAISTGYMAASQIINQATGLIKSAMAEISEGATLNRAEAQFRNYAASVGFSADQMIADMKKATGSVVNDSNLIKYATTEMFKGLKADEVVQVMKIASGVARATGGDIESSMNRVARAIETGMMRSLVMAGLVTKEESSMLSKYLQMTGDKATALAYLQAKEASQLEMLGANTEDMKKVLGQMGAAFKDMGEQVAVGLATGLEGLKPLLKDLIPLIGDLGSVILNVVTVAFQTLSVAIFAVVTAFSSVVLGIYKVLEVANEFDAWVYKKIGMKEAAKDAEALAESYRQASKKIAGTVVKMADAIDQGVDKGGHAGDPKKIKDAENEAARMRKLMEDKINFSKNMQAQESIIAAKSAYETAQRTNALALYLAQAKYTGMSEIDIAKEVLNKTIENNKLEYEEAVRAAKARETIALASVKKGSESEKEGINKKTSAEIAALDYNLMTKNEAELNKYEIAIVNSNAKIKQEKISQEIWEIEFEKKKSDILKSTKQDQINYESQLRKDAGMSTIEDSKIIYDQEIKLANDNYEKQLVIIKKTIDAEAEKAKFSGVSYDKQQELLNKLKDAELALEEEKRGITNKNRDSVRLGTKEEEEKNKQRLNTELQMYRDMGDVSVAYYDAENEAINRQVEEYRKSKVSEVLIMQWSTKEKNKLISQQIKASDDLFGGMKVGLEDWSDSQAKLGTIGFDTMKKAMDSASDALYEFATKGKADFKSLANSIIADLTKMIIKQQMANLVQSMFGKSGEGSSGGGGGLLGMGMSLIGGLVGSFSGGGGSAPSGGLEHGRSSAYGNVFNHGYNIAFADGGIISRPTLFPMANGAGLMGEAGPEAIMPLKRNASGKLGVASSGGSITVNVPVSGIDNKKMVADLKNSIESTVVSVINRHS